MEFERYYEPTSEDLQEWAIHLAAAEELRDKERTTIDKFLTDAHATYGPNRDAWPSEVRAREATLLREWTRRINSTNWNARPGPGAYGEYRD